MKITFNPVRCVKNLPYKKPLSFCSDSFSNSSFISDKTFKKACDLVMKTINCSNPTESLVIVCDDKIIYWAKGDVKSVSFSDEDIYKMVNDSNYKMKIIHSHPKEKHGTFPVSMADCMSLINEDGVVSVSAIDSKGRHSTLEKTPSFNRAFAYAIEINYRRNFSRAFDDMPELKKSYDETLKQYEQMVAFDEYDFEYINLLRIGLNNLVQEALENPNAAKIIHEFWQNHAQDIGLKYTTNFEF